MDQPPRKLLRPNTARDCKGKERCPSNQRPKRPDGISCHGGMTSSASFDFADHFAALPGTEPKWTTADLHPHAYARMTATRESGFVRKENCFNGVTLGEPPTAIQLTHHVWAYVANAGLGFSTSPVLAALRMSVRAVGATRATLNWARSDRRPKLVFTRWNAPPVSRVLEPDAGSRIPRAPNPRRIRRIRPWYLRATGVVFCARFRYFISKFAR